MVLQWSFVRPSSARECSPFSYSVPSCFSHLTPGCSIPCATPPSLPSSSRALLSKVMAGCCRIGAKTLMGEHRNIHVLFCLPEKTVPKTRASQAGVMCCPSQRKNIPSPLEETTPICKTLTYTFNCKLSLLKRSFGC